MYIKIILAFLLLGVISTKVLYAQDMQTDNPKINSKLAAQEDSINSSSPEQDRQVILPFGKSTTKVLASDITVINPGDLLMYDNINSVNEAISARIPGSMGGVNLRSLGGALIVIDGIPRPITSVNISEIEQITVLKDANAGMLYGVQANTGVILITTKRGQPDKNKISSIVETGFSNPISYPSYLGSADYMKLYNEALANDGLAPLYTQVQMSGAIVRSLPSASKTKQVMSPDADYYTSTFLKNSKPYTRVATEFSGGNQNAKFYVNLGWLRNGTLMNVGETDQHTDRLNLRTNLDFRLNDFITSRIDMVAIFDLANLPNQGNFFSDASTLKPNYYPPLIDTSLVMDKKLLKTASVVNGKYILGGTSVYRSNVYGNLLLGGYNKTFNSTVMFNTGLDFDLKFITQGLTLKTYASFDFFGQFYETQSNTYAIYEPTWLIGSKLQDSLKVAKIGVDKNSGTQGISNTSLSRDYAIYGVLDYSRIFGSNHAFSASLLGYYDKYNATGTFQSDKHAHLGARVNYIYADKYIVNFSSAYVSSPKLSPSNRLGFSPSLALGWIISDEDFLKGNSLLNFLKLKVSAGIINTDMSLTRYYSYDDIYVISSNVTWGDGFRSNYSTNLSNVANDNLFYEKRKELTVGAEAALLNNSLWIDANFFRDRKTDQIVIAGLSSTYPTFLGSLNPPENYNEEKYQGVELGASWRKSINDFSFDVGPIMIFIKSEVVKRDEFYGEKYLYRAGKSTGAIFGLESLGLFADAADVAGSAVQTFGAVQQGDIKYKDQNLDGKIDALDEIMIGNSLSKIVGGLTMRLKYKNFSLFALASARNGAERFFNNSYYWVYGDLKFSEVVLDRWTPATASTATYPRLSSKSNSNNFRSSTFWLENNSLISFDRLQLTYDLPESLASKFFTKNFSLYIRASNMLNIAENKDKMELSIGSEPQYRSFSVGLKAVF